MNLDVEKVKKDLRNRLSSYRYLHSIRTMNTAVLLARCYGYNESLAAITALLHDIAKELSYDESVNILDGYGLFYDRQFLNHAYVGAMIAKYEYQFSEEMVNAILYHTTGRKNMGLLEKIIFVADKIEPGKDYIGIEEERRLAFINIDQALICCLENRVKKFQMKGKHIEDITLETLDFLYHMQLV